MTPVLAWLTYSLVVGVLVGLSSWAGEAALRAAGRPGRWAWVGGMVISALIPLGALVAEMEWARTAAVTAPMSVIPLFPLAVTAAPAASRWSLDGLLLVAWAALAFVGLAQLVRLNRVVGRGHASGSRRRVNGMEVVVTRRLGPAVWGILRPRILMPEWALTLDTRFRRLMLLHEGEHVRAGDALVVLGGLLLAALVPWNVALWWQLSRLRSAVELDCDERVLRRVRDPLNYGGLLLEVGRRRSGPVLGVALVERMPILERRLRRIIDAARRPPSMRKALWLGIPAALLLVTAVLTRDPVMPFDRADAMSRVVIMRLDESPHFTPFTVAPLLLNEADVQKALQAEYPPLLRNAGIGGTAVVWLRIDTDGAVQAATINRSSSYPALDEAAVRVARTMRFSPAYNRNVPVEVWVSKPIIFGAKGIVTDQVSMSPERMQVLIPPVPTHSQPDLSEAPVFTPFTVAPRLRNSDEIATELERAYPAALRDAGIGGEVNVWFYIDEQGVVQKAMTQHSSGYPALDEAAIRVGEAMRFTPALNRDKPVSVWVSIPVKFNMK